MGLFDEKDITLRGIEEARKSDKVYIEFYTSKWHGNLQNLEKLIGKKIVELKRSDLEDNSERILKQSRSQNVAIFIQGSALVQTTHLSLLQDARRLKIKTKVVHNASIISAISETGLHSQKFGRYVTIPFPERTNGKSPESIFEIIKGNKKRELHTLCLLDLDVEEKRYMKVNDALRVLLKGRIVTKDTEIVVFARAGSENPLIAYDKVNNLLKRNIQDTPTVMVVTGKLHYTEKDFLNHIL
jgi:diphthine synthase